MNPRKRLLMKRNLPLRFRLTIGLLIMQLVLLIGASTFMVITVFQLPLNGSFLALDLDSEIADSVVLDDNGALALQPTRKLQSYMDRSPNLWLMVGSDDVKEPLTYGTIPEPLVQFKNILPELSHVEIRGNKNEPAISARFRRHTTDIGTLNILAGGGAFVPTIYIGLVFGNLFVAVPIIGLIVLTLIIAPILISFSLRGLKRLEDQIAKIDIGTRGTRLTEKGLPWELLPLVRGVNDALTRLDVGIEATERFFVHAAHELRTPIAVMQIRVDDLEESPEKEKIRGMLRRLTVLVNQLLEMERFRQSPTDYQPTNLVPIVEGAIVDLAPYAVSEGYSMSLEKDDGAILVSGNAYTLDRMLVNLIQNAIQHGGKHGEIIIRLKKTGVIEVQDNGPGIPMERRHEIFEPFVRINPQGGGTGLGLKMVRDIAQAHGGEVVLAESSEKGSIFRVTLPVLSQN